MNNLVYFQRIKARIILNILYVIVTQVYTVVLCDLKPAIFPLI